MANTAGERAALRAAFDATVESAFEAIRGHMARAPEWRGTVLDVPGTSNRTKAAVVLGQAFGQVANGGTFQYVDNGLAHRRCGPGRATSAMAAAAIVEAGRDRDPAVAGPLLGILKEAASVPMGSDGPNLDYLSARALGHERDLFALGHERIEDFLAALAAEYPEDRDPFDTDWRPRTDVRYPYVVVDLSRVSANAFSVVGAVAEALRKAGVPDGEIADFRQQATSSGYERVLATMTDWVRVETAVPEEDEEDEPGWGMGR